MKIISSYITLNNLKIHAFHGVGAQETLVGNEFIINARLKVDISKPGRTDTVEDTVSYADVFNIIKEEMKIPSKLLEHVAYRIVKQLFKEFEIIDEISLSLNKNTPPMGADIDSAGVTINCSR